MNLLFPVFFVALTLNALTLCMGQVSIVISTPAPSSLPTAPSTTTPASTTSTTAPSVSTSSTTPAPSTNPPTGSTSSQSPTTILTLLPSWGSSTMASSTARYGNYTTTTEVSYTTTTKSPCACKERGEYCHKTCDCCSPFMVCLSCKKCDYPPLFNPLRPYSGYNQKQ